MEIPDHCASAFVLLVSLSAPSSGSRLFSRDPSALAQPSGDRGRGVGPLSTLHCINFPATLAAHGMTHREIGKLPSSMYTRIIETGRSTVHYTYKRYPSVISSGRVAAPAEARNQQFLLDCAYARTYDVRRGRGCSRDRSHPGKKETRRARYGEGVVCGVRASGKKKLREKKHPGPDGSQRVANRNCVGPFRVVSSRARRIRYIMTFMFIRYESTSHRRGPGGRRHLLHTGVFFSTKQKPMHLHRRALYGVDERRLERT